MPTNHDLDELGRIATRVRVQPDWNLFAEYCEFRGKGERQKAFASLESFLTQAASWTYSARLNFTRATLGLSARFDHNEILLPQPLIRNLVVPTLREWREHEPSTAEASLWLGLLRCDNPTDHLTEALVLDPNCEEARRTLTDWILSDIEYNQHELPAFYIHDPRIDLAALDRAIELASGSRSIEWRTMIQQEADELRLNALRWLAAHPAEGDFASR